jgi:hypothetical protein
MSNMVLAVSSFEGWGVPVEDAGRPVWIEENDALNGSYFPSIIHEDC